MKTGNTVRRRSPQLPGSQASMEPGHEDREYAARESLPNDMDRPQWSPVMKTGNTRQRLASILNEGPASMEPGHEDREYSTDPAIWHAPEMASMEPGHEDREYSPARTVALCSEPSASMEPGHEDREYSPPCQ